MRYAENGWFRGTLLAGVCLAVVVLINSVVNFVFVSHKLTVDHLRRDMSRAVALLEGQLRTEKTLSADRVDSMLTDLRKSNSGIAYIEVRSRESVIAREGIQMDRILSREEIRSRVRNREPITATRRLPAGEIVMEIFPMRVPPGPGESQPSFASAEVGVWVDSADAAFWPVRRNLIINSSAALALLLALLVMRRKFRSWLRGQQLERELEIAREVQRALLPSKDRTPSDIAVASECIPAAEIGGDIHDVFSTPDGGAALVVGDVCGKGIPAALLMAVIHGAVRSSDWHRSPVNHENASRRLNQLLCERSGETRFASLFWGYYDSRAERLHYINAGHFPPLIVRQWPHSTAILPLVDGGPVLGVLPAARYEQASIDLCPGDLLVLYSDGVIEATNEDGEEFGEDRLRSVLEECAGQTPEQTREHVLGAVRAFKGKVEFADDVTFLAVRFDRVAGKFDEASSAFDAREVVVG
jgi:hypothetical protein